MIICWFLLKIGMNFWLKLLSLPSWERGLKLPSLELVHMGLRSLPSWERGLKPSSSVPTALTGNVAPFVGAWIETLGSGSILVLCSRSLRGSVDWNQHPASYVAELYCRSLRGSVDWNEHGVCYVVCVFDVAPFVGAWIETFLFRGHPLSLLCRSLRGSVDWNMQCIGKFY